MTPVQIKAGLCGRMLWSDFTVCGFRLLRRRSHCSSTDPLLWPTSAVTGWSLTAGGAALIPLSPCTSIFIRRWSDSPPCFSVRGSNQKPLFFFFFFLMNVFYFALGFLYGLLGDKSLRRVHSDPNAELPSVSQSAMLNFCITLVCIMLQSDTICNTADTSKRSDRAVILRDSPPGLAAQSPLQTLTTATWPLLLVPPPMSHHTGK